MNEAVGAVQDDRRSAERLMKAGLELDKKSPAEFSAFIRAEVLRWAPLVKPLMNPKQKQKQKGGPSGTPI